MHKLLPVSAPGLGISRSALLTCGNC